MVCLFLASCSEEDQIYRLKLEKASYDSTHYVEYFVINNPSKNRDTILKHIRAYNRIWLPKQRAIIKKYKKYVQVFYEETRGIDRDYQPYQLFFDLDDIRETENHIEDKILQIVIKESEGGAFPKNCNDCPSGPPYYIFWNENGIGRLRGEY